MVTSFQRFGTLSMFFGSTLYIVTLLGFSPISRIYSLQLAISVSLLIAGSIMSYGLKELDDRFLKALGINTYLIGTGYELKGALVYDELRTTYFSCILGGVFMLIGLILIFLNRGKPSKSTIYSQFFLGFLFIGLFGIIMLIDILLRFSTHSIVLPDTIDKAYIDAVIGMIFFVNGILLHYINGMKTEGQLEPDVVFFGEDSIFGLIFY